MKTQTIIKHSYIRQGEGSIGQARAHIRYLQHRPGKDLENAPYRQFFDRSQSDISCAHVFKRVDEQQPYGALIHKIIISPATPDADLRSYTRHIMHALDQSTGLSLEWYAIEHRNTSQPHCHVVVMGKDLRGRMVRFRAVDYADGRLAGNLFLDRESNKPKSIKERILRAARELANAAQVTFKVAVEQEQKWRLQELLSGSAATSLGDLPSADQQQKRRDKILKREQKAAAKLWQEYCRPISINYGQPKDEPVQYTWRTALGALRELEKEYLANDPYVRRSINPKEFEKLQLWIRHRYRDEKALQEQANNIERIELRYDDDDQEIILDSQTDPLTLGQLLTMHDRGEIYLQDPEVYAVKSWIEKQEREQAKDRPDKHVAQPAQKPSPKPTSSQLMRQDIRARLRAKRQRNKEFKSK